MPIEDVSDKLMPIPSSAFVSFLFLFPSTLLPAQPDAPREFFVSVDGNDSDTGAADSPFQTISKAAEMAYAGDTITVAAGTYRERITPPRGGTSDTRRITYQAAPGAAVYIKGSEKIKTWTKSGDSTWQVVLPPEFFADFNPYALNISGKYMTYGEWHHRGDVFINQTALFEQRDVTEIEASANRWHGEVSDGQTIIHANFGARDPNRENVEINVREFLFMPGEAGINFITVDGFYFKHAATNWSPPNAEFQSGAIGPRMGKGWIIQNCTVSDIRTVGIILGSDPGGDFENIDSFGGHVVRNNVIRKCGQSGIAGKWGATRSLVEGNLIEEINNRREFGGHETAGIKFHLSVDATISNNLIRGVRRLEDEAAFGIWIDFANQGTRISKNIIYDTETTNLFLEMNHGPILVDNNVFAGGPGLASNSGATVLVHNLFLNSRIRYNRDTERKSNYYKPHTTIAVERLPVIPRNDLWANNIFIGKGLHEVSGKDGHRSVHNLYLCGARPPASDGSDGLESDGEPEFQLMPDATGVTIRFSVDDSALAMEPGIIDGIAVGLFQPTRQSLEDKHGNSITVREDINGKSFSKARPGPLSDLSAGGSEIVWKYRKFKSSEPSSASEVR